MKSFLSFLSELLHAIFDKPVYAPISPDTVEMSNTSPTATNTLQTPISGQQRVYQTAKDNLGRHLTLNSDVSPEVGCAEALSWILLNAGYPIPQGGIPSVAALTDWVVHNGFIETTEYAPGNIIVGRSPSEAHVGICGKEMIMSNTSYDILSLGLHKGRFECNYHLNGWRKVFPITHFFIPPDVVS